MAEFRSYPKRLVIPFTDRCNLKCFICCREEYEEEIGSIGTFLQMDALHKLEAPIREAEIIQISGFGESFLHPQAKQLLEYIYSLNSRTSLIRMISNGTALSRERGSWLSGHLSSMHISLNASNADAYWREMHPYEFAAGKDLRFRFHRLTDKIVDFLSGLEPEEHSKVHLHYVVHGENLHDMPDFVQLAQRLGVPNVTFTHYIANRARYVDRSLFWCPERYNEAAYSAMALGAELGVRVSARTFFTETQRYSNRDCAWVFEEVHVHLDGQVIVCCPGNITLPVNVYKDPGGFEGVWFGDTYQRLRKKRFMEPCQTCREFQTLDEFESHFSFTMSGRYELPANFDERVAETRRRTAPVAEFYRHFRDSGLDYLFYHRLKPVHGTSMADLEAQLVAEFRKTESPPQDRVSLRLALPFPGFGWGIAESNPLGQEWRWTSRGGGSGRSTALLRLQPGRDYDVEILVHSAPGRGYLESMRVFANGVEAADQSVVRDGARTLHRSRIPAAAIAADDGFVALAVEAGGQSPEPANFRGLCLTRIGVVPVGGTTG